MAPYIDRISGSVGQNSFTSVSDVVGGKSPLPRMSVRDALQKLNSGNLIVEIPGGIDTGKNAAVILAVPDGISCPASTEEVQ
jgi:hypothetical protein